MMPPSAPPDKRVAVAVPVCGRGLHRRADLRPGREPSSFPRQRAQNLPPRFDQMERGRVGGVKAELPARVRQTPEQHIDRPVRAQVVEDRIDPRRVLRNPAIHRLQGIDPVDDRAPRIRGGEGDSRGRLEGTEDVALPSPPVIGLLRRPHPPLATGIEPDHRLPRMTLGALRAHFIQTDDYAVRRRCGVEGDDRPFFRRRRGRAVRQTRSPGSATVAPLPAAGR